MSGDRPHHTEMAAGPMGQMVVHVVPGRVPVAPIIAYLRDVRGECDGDEIDRAIRMIRAVDDEYLSSRKG